MRISKTILIIFITVIFGMAYSCDSSVDKDADVQIQDPNDTTLLTKYEEYRNQGNEAFYNNLTLAIHKYSQAELVAGQLNDAQKLTDMKSQLGYCHALIFNLGEAFQYYNQGLDVIEKAAPTTELKHSKVEILMKIGLLYYDKGDFRSSVEYYKKAETLLAEMKSTRFLKMIGINLTSAYNEMGLHQEAIKKLEAIKELDYELGYPDGNAIGDNYWQINYAETIFLLGNVPEATLMAETLYKKALGDDRNNCKTCVLKLLSRIAEKNNEYDKAIEYSQSALAAKEELLSKIEQYKRLAHLYLLKNEYPAVIKYKDSAMQAKQKHEEEVSLTSFEVNKAKLKLNEYQNEIKINQIEYKNKTKVYWIVILGAFLLSVFIFLWQKTRISNQKRIALLEIEKEKNEKLILKRQIDFEKNKAILKQEGLKSKISKKNRELSTNALYNSSRVEILNQIIRSLEQIKSISRDQELTNYIKSLKQFTSSTESWKEFTSHFEKVNPSFLQKLHAKHPVLNKSDIRFLCYTYMSLDTKEICMILNITTEAFRKRKQRTAEKLGLPKDTNLYHYVQNLENTEL